MEREWDYLLHLIRCAIHETDPEEVPEGVDLQRVYECGKYHHVANIAFHSIERLKRRPPEALYEKWQACRDQAVVLDMNQSFAADEITDGFRRLNIRWLEMQGTKLKPLYPQPEYRTMSDIDFIVDPENLKKGELLLQELGYTTKLVREREIVAFREPNIHVELHTEFFADTTDYFGVMGLPFGNPHDSDLCDLNDFYLYNILHIAKHYFYGGCGIRRVLDAYYLNCAFGGQIDHTYIHTALANVGAEDFATELLELANAWFGLGMPVRSDMATYILNSGTHGNQRNELHNRLSRENEWGLKYYLRRIAGSKQIMYATYPVLKRHKVLYPLCWLHRAFRAMLPRKRKRLKREMEALRKRRIQ